MSTWLIVVVVAIAALIALVVDPVEVEVEVDVEINASETDCSAGESEDAYDVLEAVRQNPNGRETGTLLEP